MECPFLCGFRTSNDHQAEYHITAHIELHHTPKSHFAAEDEDLKFALALQREEEERVFADVENHDTATQSPTEDFDSRTEGAANNVVDDDFPYVECPECEDFVHLVELDEHMNNNLSLQYSSDTTAGDMAISNPGPLTNPHQFSTTPGCSTTIARPMTIATEQPSGMVRTATSMKNRSQEVRLGVSLFSSSLVSIEST